ncbi:hypothetical protein IQ05_01296 [Flavobacterium tiangeerense]|uniref:Uncharacterized protein n=1 Tax=Flavobacterium tiangeerense TaxID=459471 RepID=A0ABY3FKV4_9FLAO|nr:hypothetical protein IQ05_01296 [Flavobacterium tiangeerense]
MFEDLRFYIIYLALLSSIIGFRFYYKLPNNKAKFILFIIVFSFLTEFVGKYFTLWTGLINFSVYNFYMLASFSAYIVLLYALFLKLEFKRIAICFLIIFYLFYFCNLYYFQYHNDTVFTNSFALGVVFVLLLSCCYFIEIFNSKKILNFKKSIYFWFILGILLFHVPFLPFMLAIKWFLIKNDESIFSLVLFILNLLMNGCFIIGFLWSEKRYNY